MGKSNPDQSRVERGLWLTGRFLLSAAFTGMLAILCQTQMVLATLGSLGVNISLADRLAASWHDLIGMAGGYLPVVMIALLVGFAIAAVLLRWLAWPAWLGFALGGGLAILATLQMMSAAFGGIAPIAGARGTLGLLLQGLAGAAGGVVFAWLARFSNRR